MQKKGYERLDIGVMQLSEQDAVRTSNSEVMQSKSTYQLDHWVELNEQN